jgi:hypothetical protein
MQLQSPVPRVPTNKPTGKPISAPLVATTNDPTGKPSHMPGIKPTPCLPIFPNANAFVSGKPHNFAMPQLQPAQSRA